MSGTLRTGRGPKLTCPYARTEAATTLLLCARGGGAYCGHQQWRRCKGWHENTPDAADCPVRKEAEREQN